MVDRKFKIIQWKVPYSVSSRIDNTDRCLENRMWGSLSGSDHKGLLVSPGTEFTHQYFGTSSSKTSVIELHKKQKCSIDSLSGRQHTHFSLKMGGTKCLRMIELSKEIWEFLISRGIAVTAEYLLSVMNIWANRESRQEMDSSEWKLNPQVFTMICQNLGTPVLQRWTYYIANFSRTTQKLQVFENLTNKF